MGVVKRQTIQNSVIQYIGIVLGYFNAVILFTNFLDTEQYGLTRVLIAISTIYVNFSALGTPKTLIRFFPYFKTEDQRHNGFFMLAAAISLFGFILTTLIYLALKGIIVTQYADSSQLFTENYNYVILLSLFMLYTTILEHYMIARKSTVLPYFLKSIFIRLVWIVEVFFYHYGYCDFDTFIFLYVSSYFLNFLIMLIHGLVQGSIKISFEFLKIRKRVFKVLFNYGLFSIVTGISNLLTNRIDIIMISFLIGLESTSVYSIAFYISSVILVPSTSIYRITGPVVADQWKNKNMKDMLLLYQKSSINLLLIGSFVFLCIWMNIDNLFKALRPEYAEGKWVVFILSMSVLFNMSMGINNIIIMITKYFRYDTYASITLGVMTIITNLIFIPIMGIEGAAMATLISVVAYHIYKVVLIQTKLKMQPFTIKTLLALISIVATYLILLFMPEVFDNYLLEVIFRCVIITALFGLFNRLFNISSDINEELNKYLVKARLRKPS